MHEDIPRTARYERHGWPSLARPDLKAPEGWSLEALATTNQCHHHSLSPDGATAAFVWSRDDLSNLYSVATGGGWPRQLTLRRPPITSWTDAPPRWSPDGRRLAYTADGHVHLLGYPPRLDALPPGCRFAPRCPAAFERCHAQQPQVYELAGQHRASCFLVET